MQTHASVALLPAFKDSHQLIGLLLVRPLQNVTMPLYGWQSFYLRCSVCVAHGEAEYQ